MQIFMNCEFFDDIKGTRHAKSDFDKLNSRFRRSVRRVVSRPEGLGA